MKSSLLPAATIAVFAFIVIGCSVNPFNADSDLHESFFLHNNGVDMPVWICGDTASDAALIYVNGGPGGASAGSWNYSAYAALGKRYLMVYYDQRSAGFTLGNPDGSTLTAEECAKDLDKLVDLVRIKYPAKKIFLMGISWGGHLGTVYLEDTLRQAKISGWIEIDGAHNFRLGTELSCAWISSYAKANRDDSTLAGPVRKYWSDAFDWYTAHPIDKWRIIMDEYPAEWITHVGYINRANGYVPEAKLDIYEKEMAKNTEQKRYLGIYSTGALRWYGQELWNLDATPGMHKIILPVLIVWGEEDHLLPKACAKQAYDNLGTPDSLKNIVYFPGSGHMPPLDAPAEFYSTVVDFVERYR
jgi:proline iminopeptidase